MQESDEMHVSDEITGSWKETEWLLALTPPVGEHIEPKGR